MNGSTFEALDSLSGETQPQLELPISSGKTTASFTESTSALIPWSDRSGYRLSIEVVDLPHSSYDRIILRGEICLH